MKTDFESDIEDRGLIFFWGYWRGVRGILRCWDVETQDIGHKSVSKSQNLNKPLLAQHLDGWVEEAVIGGGWW